MNLSKLFTTPGSVKTSLFILIILISFNALATDSYKINVNIDGYKGNELYLGYYYGNKQYIKDTVYRNQSDTFTFKGNEKLKSGIYLVILPPDFQYFEVLINENQQMFNIETKLEDPAGSMNLEGLNSENRIFYNYLKFMMRTNQEAKEGTPFNKELVVLSFIENIIEEHPNSLTAAMLRSNLQPDIPEFKGTEAEIQTKRWRYAQKHYFDNLDLANPALLRTPFLFQRIDYFVHKLQVQHPDTISRAIDYVLKKLEPANESYQFYLIHFLNEYAKSKIVGMDAVYVHLAKNYYAKGKAPWTDAEQLEKILKNAKSLEPLLIGKKAPDIQLLIRDKNEQSYDEPQTMSLHDFKSEFTVLFIWDNSKRSYNTALQLKAEYPELKQKGVKVFAACLLDPTYSIEPVWEFIDDNELNDWQHVFPKSKYSTYSEGLSQTKKNYNTYSGPLPLIYLLDKDKKILSKRITPEQIVQVINYYKGHNQ